MFLIFIKPYPYINPNQSENNCDRNSNNHFPNNQFFFSFKIEKPRKNQDECAKNCKKIQQNKSNRNMAVPEFVLKQQIENSEDLKDENCSGDCIFFHLSNLLTITTKINFQ